MEEYKIKKILSKFFIYLFLISGSIIMLFPFFWMVITSVKAPDETTKFPPTLIPEKKYFIKVADSDELERVKIVKDLEDNQCEVEVFIGLNKGKRYIVNKKDIIEKRFLWDNYKKAWNSAPFGLYFINNFIMALGATLLYLLTSILAAYAFAKMNFPLKNFIFMILLATLMVPGQLLLIPNYVILAKLKWIDTFWALIIPVSASVFGIYFLRQYFESIPQDLFDAAVIDGCSTYQVLCKIVIPLSLPVLLTLFLIGFLQHWNELLWPLIVTNSPEMRTLQVGLAVFRQESGIYWELLTAAASFSIVPIIILFLIVQRYYIQGIARTGLK